MPLTPFPRRLKPRAIHGAELHLATERQPLGFRRREAAHVGRERLAEAPILLLRRPGKAPGEIEEPPVQPASALNDAELSITRRLRRP